MSFRKIKTIRLCVGQKHCSGTINKVGEITLNKKIGKEIKIIIGKCVICDRIKIYDC